MTYYVFLNENNIVTEIIVGRNDGEVVDGISDWQKYYSDFRNQKCVKVTENDVQAKRIVGIDFTYDEVKDVFIPPKPFDSWILNETTCIWQAPIEIPNDGKRYYWNETTQEWIEIQQ